MQVLPTCAPAPEEYLTHRGRHAGPGPGPGVRGTMQRGLAFRAVQMQQTLLRWPPSIFHPGHLSPCSLVPTLPRAPSWKPSAALIWEHFLSPVPGAQRHGGNRERGPVFRKRPCRSSVHILGRRPACMSSEERAEQRSPPAGGGWLPAAQPQPEASLLS